MKSILTELRPFELSRFLLEFLFYRILSLCNQLTKCIQLIFSLLNLFVTKRCFRDVLYLVTGAARGLHSCLTDTIFKFLAMTLKLFIIIHLFCYFDILRRIMNFSKGHLMFSWW